MSKGIVNKIWVTLKNQEGLARGKYVAEVAKMLFVPIVLMIVAASFFFSKISPHLGIKSEAPHKLIGTGMQYSNSIEKEKRQD